MGSSVVERADMEAGRGGGCGTGVVQVWLVGAWCSTCVASVVQVRACG